MTTIIKTMLVILVMLLIGASALFVSALTNKPQTVTTELQAPPNAISEEEAKAIAQQAVAGEVTEVEVESDSEVYEVEVNKDGAAQEVTISAQTGEVLHVEEDDDSNEAPDVPITGSALERASAAALAYIGEGRVTDSEIGDEEGYYEIEIRLNNGREADVHLDENFKVLSVEYD